MQWRVALLSDQDLNTFENDIKEEIKRRRLDQSEPSKNYLFDDNTIMFVQSKDANVTQRLQRLRQIFELLKKDRVLMKWIQEWLTSHQICFRFLIFGGEQLEVLRSILWLVLSDETESNIDVLQKKVFDVFQTKRLSDLYTHIEKNTKKSPSLPPQGPAASSELPYELNILLRRGYEAAQTDQPRPNTTRLTDAFIGDSDDETDDNADSHDWERNIVAFRPHPNDDDDENNFFQGQKVRLAQELLRIKDEIAVAMTQDDSDENRQTLKKLNEEFISFHNELKKLNQTQPSIHIAPEEFTPMEVPKLPPPSAIRSLTLPRQASSESRQTPIRNIRPSTM
jgi:hypothetical protein